MAYSRPDASLFDLTMPLFERFGPMLTLVREQDRVRWCYADCSAVVELRSERAAVATFIAAPIADAASASQLRAIYAPQNTSYALTERGVTTMVQDLAAFFSGIREPRFRFIDACAAEQASP